MPERSELLLRAKARLSATRCPFCHDAIERADDPRVCRGCLALHHAACWWEDGRCASCGGAAAVPLRPPAPRRAPDPPVRAAHPARLHPLQTLVVGALVTGAAGVLLATTFALALRAAFG